MSYVRATIFIVDIYALSSDIAINFQEIRIVFSKKTCANLLRRDPAEKRRHAENLKAHQPNKTRKIKIPHHQVSAGTGLVLLSSRRNYNATCINTYKFKTK